MKKIVITSAIAFFGFLHSFAQNPVIEKAIKDPNRKTNEAKADKTIADSTRNVKPVVLDCVTTSTLKHRKAVAYTKKKRSFNKKKSS
jgi:hypothetical protein